MDKKNKGRTGLDEAYVPFKKDILDRIAEVYPKYAAECKNQKRGVTAERMW